MRRFIKILSLIIFNMIIFSCTNPSNSDNNRIKKDLTVENILDTIWTIPEVNERNDYVKEQTLNKRELMVYINGTPDELNEKYYWVKVAEDNGIAYFTHFDFFVYPNWDIKFYNRVKDKELSLDDWRKELENE